MIPLICGMFLKITPNKQIRTCRYREQISRGLVVGVKGLKGVKRYRLPVLKKKILTILIIVY